MRYSENKFDRKLNNPIQFLLFLIYLFVTSPFRLLSEIIKKLVFLGSYMYKVMLYSLILNTLLFICVFLTGIFSEEGLVLEGQILSISNLVTSFLLNVIAVIILNKLNVDIDFSTIDNELPNIDIQDELDCANQMMSQKKEQVLEEVEKEINEEKEYFKSEDKDDEQVLRDDTKNKVDEIMEDLFDKQKIDLDIRNSISALDFKELRDLRRKEERENEN